MTLPLLGLHHVTAVSARIADNVRFYTGDLGMRLVKRSVNQDDVSAYHLFYADALGSPGTDLTFFDWSVPPERRGSRSIVRTFLRVAGQETLEWWSGRLADAGVDAAPVTEIDGRPTLLFEDPEGQRLGLVDDGGRGEAHPWDDGPVPAERQVRGLGPVVLSVPDVGPTGELLRSVLGLREARRYSTGDAPGETVRVWEMGDGGPGAEVHVVEHPGLPPARQGAGAVHHVAFRIPDETYDAWARRLVELGIPNSGKVDRYWFRSLYFREPAGILFELATEGPGFTVDEDEERLGETVVLPPFLEPDRERILAGLKPLPDVGERL